MDQALAPTVAQPISLPPPPPRRTGALAIVGVVSLVIGLVLGVAIGRSAPPTPVAVAEQQQPHEPHGHVVVSSKPVDGNVTIDGRFVGVTPIERLDLDPGKHSVVIDAFGYQPYAGTLEVPP